MKKIIYLAILLFASTSNASIINIGTGPGAPRNDCTIGCMKLYQQAYDSSIFGSTPLSIDSLSIFGGSGYHGTYDVSVGYMNGDYSSITTNFAGNFSSTPVYVDSVNLATDIINGVLLIDIGFDYNALLGDFLVQFVRTSATSNGSFAASNGFTWSRAYNWSHSSTFAHSGYALNSSFSVSPQAQVPEPTSLALLGLGLAGIGFSRKKSRLICCTQFPKSLGAR